MSKDPQKIASDLKPPHAKNGEAALREILKMQTSTHFLIPKSAFERAVRDISRNIRFDAR